MRFSRKLKTWLNASVRGMMPSFGKEKTQAEELTVLQKQLDSILIKEKELAELLKKTRAQAESAREAGDAASVTAKEKLANELSAQLDTQSAWAITLEENVAVLTRSIQKSTPHVKHTSSLATESTEESNVDSPPREDADDDISARKSRLSD